jgi:hypothetical protein
VAVAVAVAVVRSTEREQAMPRYRRCSL